MTPRILANAVYYIAAEDGEGQPVERDQLVNTFATEAQKEGYRVKATSSIYGLSGVAGIQIDVDLPFSQMKGTMLKAAEKLTANFYLAVLNAKPDGSVFPKDSPLRNDVKTNAIIEARL